MNVLFINPPVRAGKPAYNFPLGLGYLASVLRRDGHAVRVLDLDAEPPSPGGLRAVVKAALAGVEVVGMGGLITTYRTQGDIVREIRSLGFRGPVILGGGLATSEYQILLERLDVDACVMGEGETVVSGLLRTLEEGGDLEEVRGVASRSEGRLNVSDRPDPIADLDALPMPDWDLFPMKSYLKTYYHGRPDRRGEGLNEMVMFTSRGCPYHCNFCYHIFGYDFRHRGAGGILDEIRVLVERYGEPFHIRFLDDCFVVKRSRLEGLCRGLRESGMDVTWSCMGRANICTTDVLAMMKEAGCTYVGYGLESGSDRILQQVIGKKASVDQNIKAVRETLRLGMSSSPTIMTNQPGETARTIRDTVRMVRKIGYANTSLFYACPYPGTPLWDYAVKSGRMRMSRTAFLDAISDRDVDELIVNLTDMPDRKLVRLHDRAEASIRQIVASTGKGRLRRLAERLGWGWA